MRHTSSPTKSVALAGILFYACLPVFSPTYLIRYTTRWIFRDSIYDLCIPFEKHSFVFQCIAHDLAIISWTRSETIWRARRKLLFLMTMLIAIAGDEEFTRARAYRESLREIIAWAQVAADRSSRYRYGCILKAHTRECIRAMQGGCHCGNSATIITRGLHSSNTR